MPSTASSPAAPLPNHWSHSIQAALLHVIALAKRALVHTHAWAAESSNPSIREAGQRDQERQEITHWREIDRIKDTRWADIPANKRPHCRPTARLAILEMRAARGWSLAQTAMVFLVSTGTVASWSKRLDEQGPDALLQTRQPVNKFPDFVRYIVQRLQTLAPLLGKVKIAQILARAGLHLSATTVGRIRKQKPVPKPAPRSKPMPSANRVTAKRTNHVWHVDLTVVPTAAGFWVPWFPLAMPQCWPFCWWVAIAVDHFSRRALATAVFKLQPTSEQVRGFVGRVIATAGTAPKHLISDSGGQFKCPGFKAWCKRHGIRHRKGAIGQHGSIAVIERYILTLKNGCSRVLAGVPLLRRAFLRELRLFESWYNVERPHTTLKGATPDEVYFNRGPACRRPRFEPRPAWPRGAPCASPPTLVKGKPGAILTLKVKFLARRRHLPVVTLAKAA
jgi:transposase InsO family protein